MTIKKFIDDEIPHLPHGAWKKGAEALNKAPQNFNSGEGWPTIEKKLQEAEKVLSAWGYKIEIKTKTTLVDVPYFEGLGE
jgi:hypothetical protein